MERFINFLQGETNSPGPYGKSQCTCPVHDAFIFPVCVEKIKQKVYNLFFSKFKSSSNSSIDKNNNNVKYSNKNKNHPSNFNGSDNVCIGFKPQLLKKLIY